MSIQCGFFNSVNNDRLYNAEQMNNPYNKIVSNGVLASPTPESSTQLKVVARTGMNIIIKEGVGIFWDKWFINNDDEPRTLSAGDQQYTRIDSVVVRIDKANRVGTIEVLQGTPTTTPVAPTLTNNNNIKEYRLANITIASQVVSITDSNISDERPNGECGWITNLLQDSDISATYTQWQTQFYDWFNNLRLTLSTVTAITSFTSRYVTTTQDETTIPIDITRYNPTLDILQVYINNLLVFKDIDYTVTDDEYIELVNGVDTGTPITFVCFKSVDGTDAESLVDIVYHTLLPWKDDVDTQLQQAGAMFLNLGGDVRNLQDRAGIQETNITKLFDLMPVSNTGEAKLIIPSGQNVIAHFIASGLGFKTMYSSAGATNAPTDNSSYTYFGQMTSTTNGYIFAISNNGDIYFSEPRLPFQGWKEFVTQAIPLWTGAFYMNATHTITPSKSLSQCKNGWVLLWSGYSDGAPMNDRVVTQVIPKLGVTGTSPAGTLYYQVMPQPITTTQNTAMVGKAIYVSNHQITGHASNNVSPANGYVLRTIYEY